MKRLVSPFFLVCLVFSVAILAGKAAASSFGCPEAYGGCILVDDGTSYCGGPGCECSYIC